MTEPLVAQRTFVALAVPEPLSAWLVATQAELAQRHHAYTSQTAGSTAPALGPTAPRPPAGAAAASQLPRVRFITPRQFHITLCFLGDTTAEQRTQVEAALAEFTARSAPLKLEIEPELTCFGSAAATSAIVASVADAAALAALQCELAGTLAALGFPRDRRSYHPHVTLARIKPPGDVRGWANRAPDGPAPNPQEKREGLMGDLLGGSPRRGVAFTADMLRYYASHMTQAGGVYELLGEYPLGA